MAEMPAPQAAPGPQAPQKAPKDLVVGINSDMMQLQDMLSSSPATQDEAKAMAGLVSQYQALVESLGQAPGAPKPEAPAPQGALPPEAGANPNARPM